MLITDLPTMPLCRTAVVPYCEPDLDGSAAAKVPALGTFQLRLRDELDFTVDFTQWLEANGNAKLTAATFAVAGDSPKTPTIAAQAFTPSGKCTVVISAPVDAAISDAYYLDVTATVAAVVPADSSGLAIPARTIVRRIHVVLVNG